MRALATAKGERVVLYTRDLRHMFHALRIGRRWEKYLAHPSVGGPGLSTRYPLHRATPMGFVGSAGWAQEATGTLREEANLPQQRRVTFGLPAPASLPVCVCRSLSGMSKSFRPRPT